jgi:hypothetical protein
VRQIRDLLKSEGVALITSPNVESPISRIKFFLRGDLSCFSKAEVTGTGHINPLFKYIFTTHLEAQGMKLLKHTFSTSLWDQKQFSGFSQKLYMAIFRVLTLFIKNPTDGQLSIYICKKH